MALGFLLDKELYRSFQSEAVVGQDGVVLDQPVGEFAVEFGEVVKQEVFVIIDEDILDSAVEAFCVGVHFGDLG